eukprot:5179581-Prymnesium_polylepis.1
MASLLTGGCAGCGVRMAARESLRRPTGVSASFALRRSPRLEHGRGGVLGKIWFFGPFCAASRLRHATRRLMRGNSTRKATPAYSVRDRRALGRALQLYRRELPRRGSCGYPAEGRPAGKIRRIRPGGFVKAAFLEGACLFVPIWYGGRTC